MTRYDMDPDGATHGIERLRAASDTFGSAWESRKQALDDNLSRIGNDVVSQAFLSRYRPIAERLTARADAIPGSYRNCCDDLRCCVDDYLAADANGTSNVHGLTDSDTRHEQPT